jgi:uncharacterized protein (UPF0332 family)
MQGRAFLDVACALVSGTSEAYWRATVIHAYYALFLECRDALMRWGIATAAHQNVHSAVRLRLVYAADTDLKQIGFTLDRWGRRRNEANYNLTVPRKFDTATLAQEALTKTTAALALLDAIDADPIRRAAAVAAFPP